MPLSSRVSRGLRNSLFLSTAALAVVGLSACRPLLDASRSASVPEAVVAAPPTGSATEQQDGSTSSPGSTTPASTTPAPGTVESGTVESGDTAGGSGEASGAEVPDVPAAGRPAAGSDRATPGDRILVGVTAGGYDQAVAGTGGPLASHAYANFSNGVPTADMITVSAANTKWREVATARPGSALYDDIVRWARTIQARGGSVMLAYNHEPESSDRLTLGSSADFVAAWRHVRAIFDQQGATNVVWTWQMTAWSFRVGPGSDQHAAKWYPGDDVVDVVGADAYNWMSCRGTAGAYAELREMADPVLDFARAHGKTAAFPEFGSHANPNRAQWLQNAYQYFVQNKDLITAAFYFNRLPPEAPARNSGCRWTLTTADEYGALRQMARDTAHFTV